MCKYFYQYKKNYLYLRLENITDVCYVIYVSHVTHISHVTYISLKTTPMSKEKDMDPAMIILEQVTKMDTSGYTPILPPRNASSEAPSEPQSAAAPAEKPAPRRQKAGKPSTPSPSVKEKRFSPMATMSLRHDTILKFRLAKQACNITGGSNLSASSFLEILIDAYMATLDTKALSTYDALKKAYNASPE